MNAPQHLDTQRWPRRESFELFRRYDQPCFNVCTRLDVAPLRAALAGRRAQAAAGGGRTSFTLACCHAALQVANEQQPFRLRLEPGAPGAAPESAEPRVRVLDQVHGSSTVLKPDDSFSFAFLGWDPSHARFAAAAQARMDAVRAGGPAFEPGPASDTDPLALMYFTSLPWLHFTSFAHARNGTADASIPKVAFGRADDDGARCWMPVSVEVHHALMDGLHVGRYVQALQERLAAPQGWLGS